MPSRIAIAATGLGLNLTEEAVAALEAYRDMLASASQHFNLTTVRDPEAIEVRHLIESLAFSRLLLQCGLLPGGIGGTGSSPPDVIDIGSGAGLPGIPLQIAFPDARVTLLESLTKRCVFLQQVVDTLHLDNARVLDGRAEDFGRDPRYRESFDLVIARAVAPMPVLIEYALPFLRTGGSLAATKGSATVSELAESATALAELGGEHVSTLPFEPPGGMAQSVIIVRKVRSTPERYPRRAGIPTKRPIS